MPKHHIGILRKSARKLKQIFKPPLHKPQVEVDYVFLGSEYGGWPVKRGSLTPESCVYSFGIGDDISFDMGVIDTFGCTVRAFDPTPRCLEWLRIANTPREFDFHPVGLSDKTQILRFSAPPVSNHVSYTVGVREEDTDFVELPVMALDEVMAEIGDSGRTLDLLKMDIEGSEYEALPDMLAKGILPEQLCVEFHHGMFGFTDQQTRYAVAALNRAGYKLYFVSASGREYGFHR